MDKIICPKCKIEGCDHTCPKCGMLLSCPVKKNPFSSVATIATYTEERWQKPVIGGLVFFLAIIVGLSYWRFVYYKPSEFISPVVLSAKTSNKNGGVIPLAKFNQLEQTVSVKVDLEEGNFLVDDFYQFVPSNIALSVQGFGIENILKNHGNKSFYESFKKDFDVTDDDLKTFLSSGFLILFPGSTINEWGFAIRVNEQGKNFVEERVNLLNDNLKEEKDNYKYKKYNARLVKIVTKGEKKEVVDSLSADELLEKSEELKKDDKTEKEEKDIIIAESTLPAESTDEAVVSKTEYFLLVSTSQDFLDQMKENSEGNIENITTALEFVRARKELPGFGQLFIFKQGDKNAWEGFVGRFVLEYEEDGLEDLLNSYRFVSVVMHSIDSKLKISRFGITSN